VGLRGGDGRRCGHMEREKKNKKRFAMPRSQLERERGLSVLSWEEELGVLSFICKICGTNEYMPRVLFLKKRKIKKFMSNAP
jgi:hypothetical protein